MPLQQAAAVSHLTYFFNTFNLSFKQQKQHTTTILNTTRKHVKELILKQLAAFVVRF